jgi:ubiquinone/menaquinone biosynthesis C-methylase UbiE
MTPSLEHTAPIATKGLVIHWAARYDLVVWLLLRGKERAFREHIVSLAGIKAGDFVLDIGCGTGSLAIAAARAAGNGGMVAGVDPSPQMIGRARWKASKAKAAVDFHLAPAERLPFPDARFDVVLSTLMLHHLPRQTRQECAVEVRRVLKPGGRVLAVDFGKPKKHGGLIAHFHRHHYFSREAITALLESAGLAPARSGEVGMANMQFVVAERRE